MGGQSHHFHNVVEASCIMTWSWYFKTTYAGHYSIINYLKQFALNAECLHQGVTTVSPAAIHGIPLVYMEHFQIMQLISITLGV